ncbi:putative peptidoglycan lipid II flippase [Ereboglobus sp. PH5-10]|nr:putative peptidoglycan lipid II flippase [Ereboglobus sp. PH5-10]
MESGEEEKRSPRNSIAKHPRAARANFLLDAARVATNAGVSRNLKNIGLVSGATMVSRVLGLVRDMQTAAVFGLSGISSAFFTAYQLPNLFRRLLGEGSLTAAFVPTLNIELEQRRREGAFALVNQVASWLTVVAGAVVVAAMIFFSQPPWIEAAARVFTGDNATVQRWLLSGNMTVVLFPYLLFVCLASVFSSALQSLGRFLEPALSPIWLNLAMIGMLWLGVRLWPDAKMTQVYMLCAGVLVGGLGQMCVPGWALLREGWRPRFTLELSEPVRAIFRLMAPTVLGSAVYLINMTVSRYIALSLNDGAVALLNFAQRLMELPIGVFAVAVSTVVFPLISRFAAQNDTAGMANAYRKGMRLILLINIPAAAGLGVLALPLIRLLFQRGEFVASDTFAMAPVLAIYAVGLPFFSFVNLVLRAFYARRDTKTPVVAALLSFVVNIVLSLALMGPLSTAGLAIAGNAAIIVQAVFLQVMLTRKAPEMAFIHIGRDLGKIIIASAAMGAAVWGGWRAWTHLATATTFNTACGLAIMIAAGVALYAALAWVLRIEGRDEARAMILKRIRPRSR